MPVHGLDCLKGPSSHWMITVDLLHRISNVARFINSGLQKVLDCLFDFCRLSLRLLFLVALASGLWSSSFTPLSGAWLYLFLPLTSLLCFYPPFLLSLQRTNERAMSLPCFFFWLGPLLLAVTYFSLFPPFTGTFVLLLQRLSTTFLFGQTLSFLFLGSSYSSCLGHN